MIKRKKDGLAPFDAVVEATVQRSRPVILTALAAMRSPSCSCPRFMPSGSRSSW
jgi:hypothetical protein